MVQLEVDVWGLEGLIPFCVSDGFGSAKYDAVLGCNVLGLPGILGDVHCGRILGPTDYFLAPSSAQAGGGSSQENALHGLGMAKSNSLPTVRKIYTEQEHLRWNNRWPQPTVKTFINGLYKQYNGAGLPRQQQLLTLSMLQ